MSDVKWINAIANDSLLYADFVRDLTERKSLAERRAIIYYRSSEEKQGENALGEADAYQNLIFHVNNAYKEGRKEDKQ